MAYCTLNGAPVLEAAITLPRVGAWHGTLAVDADSPPSGALSLQIGGANWRGFARRSGVWGGVATVRIVGGAGGLSAEVAPQGFRNAQLGAVLQHILRAGGESLASGVDSALLSRVLNWWAAEKVPAGVALAALAESAGLAWRVLPGGSVWMGEESWPAAEVPGELLGFDAAAARVELFLPEPTLMPGAMLGGRNVGRVEYLVGSDRIRAIGWFEG